MKNFVLLIAAILLIQSCAKDDDDSMVIDNGGQNNEQVALLEHRVASDWMGLFLELERYASGMRPNASARALAYINLAAYETAVPAMNGFVSNSGLIPGFELQNITNVSDIDWELALNTCYADVMAHFLLNVSDDLMTKIDALEASLESEFTGDLSEQTVNNSKQRGRDIARQIIAYSQTDTEAEQQILNPQPLSYEPPLVVGYWTYSAEPERALFPYWEDVRTFVVAPNNTTTVAPLAYSEDINSQYYAEMMEAYESNNAARAADGEELWIAEFWSDDVESLMFGPPSRQFSIANQLLNQYDLNLEETLHLFLKLGFSLNDAAVATWKYKYHYMVMRPSEYIKTLIDPDYQTNLYPFIYWPNPTFPSYPSGHSCFASAGAGVFIDFFGNETNFTDRSHEGRTEFRGMPRSFSSFEEMAHENAYSRIPLGVHMRMDCTEGLRLGYEISDAIANYSVKK